MRLLWSTEMDAYRSAASVASSCAASVRDMFAANVECLENPANTTLEHAIRAATQCSRCLQDAVTLTISIETKATLGRCGEGSCEHVGTRCSWLQSTLEGRGSMEQTAKQPAANAAMKLAAQRAPRQLDAQTKLDGTGSHLASSSSDARCVIKS